MQVEKEKETTISEIPESPEIPPEIQKAGVSSYPPQFTNQVKDDTGKSLITPVGGGQTLTVPAGKAKLVSLSKGKITEAVTWFAAFWLRMIKKAVHFGVNIVLGKK